MRIAPAFIPAMFDAMMVCHLQANMDSSAWMVDNMASVMACRFHVDVEL